MKKAYAMLGAILTVVGVLSVNPASVFLFIYHPRVPKCLQK